MVFPGLELSKITNSNFEWFIEVLTVESNI